MPTEDTIRVLPLRSQGMSYALALVILYYYNKPTLESVRTADATLVATLVERNVIPSLELMTSHIN